MFFMYIKYWLTYVRIYGQTDGHTDEHTDIRTDPNWIVFKSYLFVKDYPFFLLYNIRFLRTDIRYPAKNQPKPTKLTILIFCFMHIDKMSFFSKLLWDYLVITLVIKFILNYNLSISINLDLYLLFKIKGKWTINRQNGLSTLKFYQFAQNLIYPN